MRSVVIDGPDSWSKVGGWGVVCVCVWRMMRGRAENGKLRQWRVRARRRDA